MSYYNHMLRKLREEESLREKRNKRAGMHVCRECGQHTYFPLIKTIHTGTVTDQMYFCGETCANEFYMKRLRGTGL